MRALDAEDAAKSTAGLTAARKWLDTCSADHAECFGLALQWYPSRLIDIGQDTGTEPRLCDSAQSFLGARYSTLSHYWGDQTKYPVPKLQAANLKFFKDLIPQSQRKRLDMRWKLLRTSALGMLFPFCLLAGSSGIELCGLLKFEAIKIGRIIVFNLTIPLI